MSKESAGLLLYRRRGVAVEVLIVHPGGPFWANKDDGAWSIPKGEINSARETREAAARREFHEETGYAPTTSLLPLNPVKLKSGKVVHAFACEGEFDPARLVSNTFEMEWPRGSGRTQSFPEVDQARWCDPDTARRKLNPAQSAFVDELVRRLAEINDHDHN